MDDRARAEARRRISLAVLPLAGLAIAVGAAFAIGRRAGTAPVRPAAAPPGTAEALRVEVLASHPHDPAAYTQGLVWFEGKLFESTGLEGRSSLREVDPATGVVRRQVDLAPDIFGEGLALVGERLVQLSWQNGVAFVYDRDTFASLGQYPYAGEGWGLCFDGQRLVMSDGSDRLTFRDPDSFDALGSVPVTLDGQPMARLNELECVGPDVYANVWLTDTILRIDPTNGTVRGVIDASGLLSPEDIASIPEPAMGAVLNGIAYDPMRDVFLVTGKLWPKLFEARFVPAATPGPGPSPTATSPGGTPTAALPYDAFLPQALDRT